MARRLAITTEEIILDYNSLPADISKVEWFLRTDYDALMEQANKLEASLEQLANELRYSSINTSNNDVKTFGVLVAKSLDRLIADFQKFKGEGNNG